MKGALRVPRSHVSPELLARAPRSRFATVHRVPHFLRFSCFLDWLFSSVYERCNNIRTLVLCLTSFGGIISALIRFFVVNYLQALTEKRPERSLLMLRKLMYLSSSQFNFFFGFVRSKYIQVLYINVLDFTLLPSKTQVTGLFSKYT